MDIIEKSYKYLILSASFILLSSCVKEVYNITCKGIIVDEETMIPLPNAQITSSCTYQQNIDNSTYIESSTSTDSLGTFLFNFDKGYKISMIIDAENYHLNNVKYFPGSEQLPDTIYLKRKIDFRTSLDKEAPVLK